MKLRSASEGKLLGDRCVGSPVGQDYCKSNTLDASQGRHPLANSLGINSLLLTVVSLVELTDILYYSIASVKWRIYA